MSDFLYPQLMLPATELKATMTGASVLVGTLLQPPVKLIFDNLSEVQVIIATSLDNGATKTNWKTFSPGEALVIDSDLWSFQKGISFYGTGASGDFSIAYTFIKQ